MAFKKTSGEVIGELNEELAVLSESERSDWVKGLAKISWHGKEPNIEIRSYNKSYLNDEDPAKQGRAFGKGIALTDDELNVLTEVLVELGYGDTKTLKRTMKSRSSNED